MKEIPILFSTPMVQANLDNRKSMTRRTKGLEHIDQYWSFSHFEDNTKGGLNAVFEFASGLLKESIPCQYGRPGDVLWVREEHYRFGAWIEKEGVYTKGGRQKWQFISHTDEILYEPPKEYRKGRHHKDPYTPAWHKRLARFMPKEAARIWLQVTDIRVERLEDISEEDAIAEGVWLDNSVWPAGFTVLGMPHWETAKQCFEEFWRSINGPESRDISPWVWVISYKILSKTGKPDLQNA